MGTLYGVVADSFITVVKTPPFRIQEEGWGEFDMQIALTAADKDHFVTHDLNFAQNRYESKHLIVSAHTPLSSSDQPWTNAHARQLGRHSKIPSRLLWPPFANRVLCLVMRTG